MAPRLPGLLNTLILLGQLITGGFLSSFTVIVKEQLVELFDVSIAVQVTVVAPNGKKEPEGGIQENVTSGQLSLTVGEG